jgi:cyanophycinase
MSTLRRLMSAGLAMSLLAGAARPQGASASGGRALAEGEVKGTLLIAGGAVRFDNAPVWNRFVELAGGAGAPIVVVPAAAYDPKNCGQAAVENLIRYGANAEMVPIAPLWKGLDYRAAASDEKNARMLRRAKGIWFIGGQQRRITQALFDEGGGTTPALAAIWDAYRNGAVIGGTSAGAAIMSQWMFADALGSLDTIKFGITKGVHVDRGLGFIGSEWFVDQHFVSRGRFARALCAMRDYNIKYGIGIDEDTAVVFKDGTFEVVGHNGALVLDVSGAQSDPSLSTFNMKRARLTFLDVGDRMDARTRTVSVSPLKAADMKIDPKRKDFAPWYEGPEHFYHPDMFGGSAIYEAMRTALDSKRGVVKGVAFSQPDGGPKNELGFEFMFYRGQDTIGWYTGKGGHHRYTVLNAYVDVTPVQLATPLYTSLTSDAR